MKSILGFLSEDLEEKTPETREAETVHTDEPVKSLVMVSFPDTEKSFAYYNDKFDLQEGDRVFVSGKFEGKAGTVESVNTRFKIHLNDYEKVLSRFRVEFHGEYERVLDKMVCTGSGSLTPDVFRSWVLPPEKEDGSDMVAVGDGYCFELSALEQSDDIDSKIVDRALEYCGRGNVLYISVINGVGTAFVRGTRTYEINFRYSEGTVSELYCDCPYPGLCKHNLAMMITLRAFMDRIDTGRDFIAVDSRFFWLEASRSAGKITLE